jgi:DNA-binding transcriptional regulator YiaG
MADDAYTRTFRRAIDTMGSAERLARALGASVAEIESWANGTAVPPPGAFLAAIDIVAHAGIVPIHARAAKS